MKEISFDIGDKVVTIKDGELRKGLIYNVYLLNPPVFVVKFEDGTVEKVPYNNVAPEPKTETPEEKKDPVEKSEITITPDEFRNAAIEVLSEQTTNGEGNVFENFAFGLKVIPILTRISARLFSDEKSEKSDSVE